MENNMPLATSKRVWNIMKVVFFMVRKGICKRKLMVDLNMMLKRGKIAGKTAIGNLISHHHHHGHASSSGSSSRPPPPPSLGAPGPREYEFSCSNTPAHNHTNRLHLPWKPRKSNGNSHFHNFLFGCTHLAATHEEDPNQFSFDCQVVLEMLENPNHFDGPMMEIMTSPMLPGFGATPKARQLRITDSPFPLKNDDEDDYVDKAAEEFIAKFYKQLRQQ